LSQLDLVQGTLDLIVLTTLRRAPMHGYQIARRIQTTTNDTLMLEEGSLYPALYRMERKGWIRSEWGTTENNRRARYYSLTAAGKKQLASETRDWQIFTEMVHKIMQEA
jgi:PadR family transcriptional regulator, regulatory protein PadR